MSRRHVAFTCAGDRLFGTVDEPDNFRAGAPGLLIVSGGNEVRAGAWAGQALLAARIAECGFPVFRFDRRGVGESEGQNVGFRHSADDIIAAQAAFRAEVPQLGPIVGLGNCDAASALMLGQGCGLNALVLSNPWTIEHADAPPPPAALRAHYARRLASPTAVMRLLRGGVEWGKLAGSLRAMLRPVPKSGLAEEMRNGLAGFRGPVAILLAGRDRTAQAFQTQWDESDPRLAHCPGASHSYAEDESQKWLEDQILKILTSTNF